MTTVPSVTLTITGQFVNEEAATLFVDGFNEWARNDDIDELFTRTDDTPSGHPESDYRIEGLSS